jgi:glycogen debranching enzyme
MARPIDPHDISLTGGGAALVTSPDGSIRPDAAHGLVVDDRRVLSSWRLDTIGAVTRRVGWQRTGPSSDRLLFSLTTEAAFDPIGLLEVAREVTAAGFEQTITITAYAAPCRLTLWLTAERDDQVVFHLGDADPDPDDPASTRTLLEPVDGSGTLHQPGGGGATLRIEAAGWHAAPHALAIEAAVETGASWTTQVTVAVATGRRSPGQPERSLTIRTAPHELGNAVRIARDDLQALTMPVGAGDVVAAGSPYFLALFARDSMIAGIQYLIESHSPLVDVLTELAAHQAEHFDDATGAQPGRILHELRVGRAGVFGLPAGAPYYGAVDTPALFVCSLGEAARWGAPEADIAKLMPAATAALDWCAAHGDADGDGFIESVPHATGLTNLSWKDSADSIIDRDGTVIVGNVATCELQGYWYRALRSFAALERWLGTGDGAAHDRAAGELAERFCERFVFEHADGPFVGLALDPGKRLLDVRTSNAGHVMWSGILPPAIASSVAAQLAGPALFSGWGIRTVADDERGYNPFGYHRGSVWPHDTALAMLGASQHRCDDATSTIGSGLLALATALDGELPELVSGLARSATTLPVPYSAACRPQAWAAGATLMIVRALVGLEPDVTSGTVRLHPCLPEGMSITIDGLRLGRHHLSCTVHGREVESVETTLDVVAD